MALAHFLVLLVLPVVAWAVPLRSKSVVPEVPVVVGPKEALELKLVAQVLSVKGLRAVLVTLTTALTGLPAVAVALELLEQQGPQ
jgi:hypothetical protein